MITVQKASFGHVFLTSLNANPKGTDGKQRVLSIIAENFSYSKLNNKLKVCTKIVLMILISTHLEIVFLNKTINYINL